MNVIVTAGPTREYIDTVRFITNASSGTMGYAVAAAAAAAGHSVTLLSGHVGLEAPAGCQRTMFSSVGDLKRALDERFDACEVLVMAAAVGDFRVDKPYPSKLRRRGGPIVLRLFPTEDILAGLGRRKKPGQTIIAFAVEDGTHEAIEAKARAEMSVKNANFVVVNTPSAMASQASHAAILSESGLVLPWADRPKAELAHEIVKSCITRE